MNAIEKDFCASFVRDFGGAGNIHNRAKRIRRDGARNQTSLGGNKRLQVFDVKVSVLAHLPPKNFCAVFFQRHPGSDIGFVIHVRNNNFVALTKRLSNRETYETNKRCRVHPKRDFAGVARVQEIGDAFASVRNCRVNLLAFCVASAALDVAFEQMAVYSIEDDLRNLRPGGIVEEREGRRVMQRRKERANGLDRKIQIRRRARFCRENILRFGLQTFAPE